MKINQILFIYLFAFFCVNERTFSQTFKVKFSENISSKPFSGRVFVFLSKQNKNPLKDENFVKLQPVFASDIVNLKPEKELTIGQNNDLSYPVALSDLERGEYYATVLFDNNLGERSIMTSAGNFINKTKKILITQNRKQTYQFVADSIIAPTVFKTNKYRQEFTVKSELLSTFYKKDTYIKCGVALPKKYFENEDKYPLTVDIEGFGGDYKWVSNNDSPADSTWYGLDAIYLEIDANCSLGHNELANSANNGPWGDAVISELLPAFEKQYRCNGFRYVTGHSSGGWASLWLKLNYPDKFQFCWSSSPDYIDFTAFQTVDIYKSKNFYYDVNAELTSYVTLGGYWQILSNKEHSLYENVVNRGEQLSSFEAVFSPKDKNNQPKKLWNRQTGEIDSTVAHYWKQYDVKLFLLKNYRKIKDNIDNEIIISVGNQDNCDLNTPVENLKKVAEKEGMKIQFRIVAGDHFTIDFPRLQKEVFVLLKERYKIFLNKK